jgi:hypothetical protein
MFYFLAIYPALLSRLRTEILTKVGSTRAPTYDDIRELRYLRAVINGMRPFHGVFQTLNLTYIQRR